MKCPIRVTPLFSLLGLSFVLACSQAFAIDDFLLDFNGDPGPILPSGTAEWRASGGVDDSGYLKITDAIGDQRGVIIIGDLDEGEQVIGFNISADLRVGGGTPRPADGFSFNFARFDDPAILDVVTCVTPGTCSGVWSPSPAGEANLPEEGTQTGFAIGFDEWQSGPVAPAGTDPTPDFDVVGLSLRINETLVAQAELPVLNDGDDEQSLQTGPEKGAQTDEQALASLGWAPLTMSLDAVTGDFVATWKGELAFHIPGDVVNWEPAAGALVFGGRTGGANAYHHIDNIRISTTTIGGPPCDFDDNGGCDNVDIDLLGKEILAGTNNPDFDLTGDSIVDILDQDQWRADAATENGFGAPYLPGDATLDGTVNSLDLNALALAWNTSPDPWSDGDFNIDGNVNAQDLNLLALSWQQSIPVAAAAAAVPEPTTALLLVIGIAGLVMRRRR